MTRLRLATLALALTAGAARAQFRCMVEYGCRGHAPDARRAASAVTGDTTIRLPEELFVLDLPPVLVPPVVVSTDADPSKSTVDVPAGAIPVVADADTAIEAATSQPTAAFRARLADPYRVTGEDEVVAAWRWYEKEPPELTDEVRTGNAVIRMVQALGRPPTGGSLARPLLDDSKSVVSRARLRDGAVVVARTAPWGPHSGTSYSGGAVLELVPPASGVWFHVKANGRDEWVAGLWLDF